jgi:hypothetical protein
MRTGQKHHLVQAEYFPGRSRDEKVPEMKRIKGPAEKTDPQG